MPGDTPTLTPDLRLVSESYFRKLVELIRPFVPDGLYAQLLHMAAGHAGGAAPHAPKAEPEPAPEPAVLSLPPALQQPAILRLEEAPTELQTSPNTPQLVVNERGWVRKAILRTGEWALPPPGGSEPLLLTLGHLQMIKDAFDQGAFERVSVPIGHGHDLDDTAWVTANNTGFVMQLDIEAHPLLAGEFQLVGWIEFTNPGALGKVVAGDIWGVSVLVLPGVQRPSDGKLFPLALKHVALTNYPWVDSLGGFSAAQQETVPAGALLLSLTVPHSPKEVPMPEDKNPAPTQEPIAPERLAVLLALEAKQNELTAREQRLAEQERKNATEARDTRITNLLLALEGKQPLAGVTLPTGFRHCPALVVEAEKLLRATPVDAAPLRLSLDGQEQSLSVEGIVLRLMNALPEAALLKLEQPAAPPRQPADPPAPAKRGPQNEDEAGQALAQLGLQ